MNQYFASVAGVALCFSFASGCQQPQPEYTKPAPPTVRVASPVTQSVTLFLEANGETEPVARAEVRCRVRGYIQEIPFQPGQRVTPETVLYVIDQTEYQNKLDAATASLTSAQAAVSVAEASANTVNAVLTQAETELKRQKQLLDSNATSPSEYENALAARDSAVAELQAGRANIELAKSQVLEAEAARVLAQMDFEYTTIRAPIAGLVSESKMDLGNLVENGTHLATVVDSSQVLVRFTISDQKLKSLVDSPSRSAESQEESWRGHPVLVRRQNDQDWVQGALDYVDREGIDRQTGTFALRAVLDNAQRRFVPGMFVEVRLPVEDLTDAVLIPERALVKTPVGNYVFVVLDNNEVEQRELTLGQQLDGWVVVESGLEAGEKYVVEGLQRVVPGKPVTPQSISLSPPSTLNQQTGDPVDEADSNQELSSSQSPTE